VLLTDYDGAPTDAIKVGTVKRAKGLEFKHVLLPEVRASDLAEAGPPADDTRREQWERERRELYVAMTRARDGLWVGVV
jgi:superfamily I DNA/RNA helicase